MPCHARQHVHAPLPLWRLRDAELGYLAHLGLRVAAAEGVGDAPLELDALDLTARVAARVRYLDCLRDAVLLVRLKGAARLRLEL